MLACYFRSLFENTKDGIIHSGCIRDHAHGIQTSFSYTAGSYGQNISAGTENLALPSVETCSGKLDFYVLGAYTINYICRMIETLSKYSVEVVILPYLTPIQRFLLAEQIPNGMKERKEVIQFLDAPYSYLKNQNIEQVYFLYENGKTIPKEMDFLVPGYQFEPVEESIRKLVYEMEGCQIPIVKAGYIVLGQWMFYFGVYGPDVKQISQYVREELADEQWETEGSIKSINKIMGTFQKKFGSYPYASIMMYQGPICARPSEKDSFLAAKVYHREQGCGMNTLCDGVECAMRCLHEHDHDIMQYHKNKEKNEERFGVLVTGNVNMRKYFPEVAMRFWNVKEKIRVVTLPNCGADSYWNSQLLPLLQGKDTRYWLCPIRKETSTRALFQILTESSFNRLIQLNHEYGFCLSGYLVPVEEGRRL